MTDTTRAQTVAELKKAADIPVNEEEVRTTGLSSVSGGEHEQDEVGGQGEGEGKRLPSSRKPNQRAVEIHQKKERECWSVRARNRCCRGMGRSV